MFTGFSNNVSLGIELYKPADPSFWNQAATVAHQEPPYDTMPFYQPATLAAEKKRIESDMKQLVRGVGVLARIHGGEHDQNAVAYAYASEVQDYIDKTWAVMLGGVAVKRAFYGHGLSAVVAASALGVYPSGRTVYNSPRSPVVEMLLYHGFEGNASEPLGPDDRIRIPTNLNTVDAVLAAIPTVFDNIPSIGKLTGRRT